MLHRLTLPRLAPLLLGAPLLLVACGSSSGSSNSGGTTTPSVTSPSSPVGSATPTTTPPASTATAACMVGHWTASSVQISHSGGSFSGGAGATWDIGANGAETIDWNNSGYFLIAGNPDYRYTGTETDTVQIPTSSASAGAWSAKVDTDVRTAVYSPTIASATGKSSEPVPSTAGLQVGGTWTCSGSSLTIDAVADGSTIDVHLTRS